MIIDAMDILYSGKVDGFCILSSDSDFTRLAGRLREAGMLVIGMGEKKTVEAFRTACSVFKYLEVLMADGEEDSDDDVLSRQDIEESVRKIITDNNAMAIGSGTAILIGRYVGAGERDLAYKKVWFSVKSALIFTFVMVALVITLRENLMGLFTDNEEIIKIGSSVLLISIFLETGRTVNITIINSLRASGDAAYPVRIGFVSMILIGLSLGYIFVNMFVLLFLYYYNFHHYIIIFLFVYIFPLLFQKQIH